MGVLKPLLSAHGPDTSSTGRLLMGTVRGDLHDIGKNLVCMMAEGAGFVVKDIGVDQNVDKFLAASTEFKPDIIGMSALLTTTMTYMKTVIDGFQEKGIPMKFAIGGAPISQMFADEIGADGYGQDASAAVDLFLRLVGKDDPQAAPAPVAARTKPSRPAGYKAEKSNYQILYWQDIPSALKVWDDYDEVKIELPPRFAERIDSVAQRLGLTQSDAYTAQLRWGDEAERAGSIDEVATAVQQELEAALT
jgi:cobalamin-dependent methionine synthase I